MRAADGKNQKEFEEKSRCLVPLTPKALCLGTQVYSITTPRPDSLLHIFILSPNPLLCRQARLPQARTHQRRRPYQPYQAIHLKLASLAQSDTSRTAPRIHHLLQVLHCLCIRTYTCSALNTPHLTSPSSPSPFAFSSLPKRSIACAQVLRCTNVTLTLSHLRRQYRNPGGRTTCQVLGLLLERAQRNGPFDCRTCPSCTLQWLTLPSFPAPAALYGSSQCQPT
ncbi:hypothetical protein EI94DRAFT_676648 [Lactarius quietus]|nr:hypothetical protein EI94DRAFT_676648 [Lactarius quietus]